jgi:hypothetical protein
MYAMYNSLVDDSALRALGVLGDDVIVAGTSVESQFPCPPGACSFDWVTLFPTDAPTTVNGSKRLLNNQFVNYAGDGQGGSTSWESIYVPEGWRATVLWMAPVSGSNIANDGYLNIEVIDGPAFKQFTVKRDPSTVEWLGVGRFNSMSIDFKSGQVLNFVPGGASPNITSSFQSGAAIYPRLSHIQAFDLRTADMKARQQAEAERRLQVKSLQTEAKLSELDAEAAARVAKAAQDAADALAAAKANQAAREQARSSYTTTQSQAAGAQISELISETTAARLSAEQKQNQLANEQKLAQDQQYVTLRNQVLSKDYRSWLPYALGGIGLLGVIALGYARMRR